MGCTCGLPKVIGVIHGTVAPPCVGGVTESGGDAGDIIINSFLSNIFIVGYFLILNLGFLKSFSILKDIPCFENLFGPASHR